MARKREKPEDIVIKLEQVELPQGQGVSVAKAMRKIGVAQQKHEWRRRQHETGSAEATEGTGGGERPSEGVLSLT